MFDLLNTGKTCQDLPPFPNQINGAIGETVNGFPLICGGYLYGSGYQNGCFALKQNTWTPVGNMRQHRQYASSLVMANGSVLILGGSDGTSGLSTTELMEMDSDGNIIHQSPGPNLPKASSAHCSVLVSSSKVLVAGGDFKRKTHFYNLESGSWRDGPQLQDSGNRIGAACGKITDKGSKSQ